jgi:hypothetical protein
LTVLLKRSLALARQKGFETLLAALIGVYSDSEEAPTINEVSARAAELAPLLGYEGEITSLVEEALLHIQIRMGIGHSLIDSSAAHDPDWTKKRRIDWTYTNNYSRFLREEGWNPAVVTSLEIVTERIVSLLQDPAAEGSWDRRGLVIGHVQSGKTANYLGLVARAADAGYRFIVIVAGIHNNLRRQTQERIDSGFVGQSSDPQSRVRIGVGKFHGHPRPVVLTNLISDFNKQNARQMQSGLADWSKPVVVVIKKNVSTLSQIHSWLRDFSLQTGEQQISGAPMLFIDDEADNASVNTSKPDLDPTRTNALIREILALFRKSCYVGYTATPFANIFINPSAYDARTREDLFPRDFIYCLDAPSNYFGAERIFLEDEGEAKHLRKIDDAEDILPLQHKKNTPLNSLPGSLRKAIQIFVLTRAIRNLRGQTDKHCSMLINVSRFVDVQQSVRIQVHTHIEALRNAIRANYALPEKLALKNAHMSSLRALFDVEFSSDKETWGEVATELDNAIGSIRVIVVNSSKSDDPLDYAAYAAKGEALNVIAIGGLSLSRGLTIEGLTVSYMYRNTKMYDTLMQMGRWFGYRPGYEDLCRIYLSEQSSGWYTHIATATEELRDRVKEMRRLNKSPRDFGLLVQSHPDALLVTAANKMRFAATKTIKVSYDGALKETFVLSDSNATHDRNRALLASLFGKLSDDFPRLRADGNARPECAVWREIGADTVEDFLREFEFHPHHNEISTMIRSYLVRIRDQFPKWDIAFIRLVGERGSPLQIRDFKMIAQTRSVGRDERGGFLRSDAGPGYFVSNKQRLAGARDERVGLTSGELAKADALARNRGKNSTRDIDYRDVSVRGRPLLMLHLIDVYDGPPESSPLLIQNAPALGASFPATGDFKQIDYVLNQVMIDQLEKEAFDLADDDEDFDP